ncbi:Yip1 domain-containing protein [Melghirimyces thermohalophilus]|uniref:Yip1 domain-containing protein n=1 Tax=Melghirimyces thermohalophilus TaxID=1236220 RepID=A0A1G6RMX9_9BACL|nr:YIP1 family protein [Melghirimyces thermohalophilus]SDD05296.1 Yip1 domain-containing protein [Melghirimyces thermohalophilus]
MEPVMWVENKPGWAVWVRTRMTIRSRLEDPFPSRWGLFFIPLFGISMTLDQISFSEYGVWYTLSHLLLVSLPIGLAAGWVVWLLYGALFWGAGRLIGGEAGWKEMQWALVWALVPYTAKLIIWLFRMLCFGEETFTLYTPTIDNSFPLLFLYFFFFIVDTVLTIWFYLILIKSVAEAHRFSAWRGAAVVLLSLVCCGSC